MKIERISVEFVLDEEQVKRLERIAGVLRIESVEECFRFLMRVGSRHLIDGRLDFAERVEPCRSALGKVEPARR